MGDEVYCAWYLAGSGRQQVQSNEGEGVSGAAIYVARPVVVGSTRTKPAKPRRVPAAAALCGD
jgi:hypothetical protein